MSGGQIHVEAYVIDDGYIDEYVGYSDPAATQASTTGEIPDTSQLEWLVPQGFTKLVLEMAPRLIRLR